jgi:hypothetical protein
VRRLYHEALGRDADWAGLHHWVSRLHAGTPRADVVAGVWHSVEHAGLLADQFYATYLNRVPEAAGRAHWVSALVGGTDENEVAVSFLTSEEYCATHPDLPGYLTNLYRDVLGRAPDEGGLASRRPGRGVPRGDRPGLPGVA